MIFTLRSQAIKLSDNVQILLGHFGRANYVRVVLLVTAYNTGHLSFAAFQKIGA